jgi:hypothetical protein
MIVHFLGKVWLGCCQDLRYVAPRSSILSAQIPNYQTNIKIVVHSACCHELDSIRVDLGLRSIVQHWIAQAREIYLEQSRY